MTNIELNMYIFFFYIHYK